MGSGVCGIEWVVQGYTGLRLRFPPATQPQSLIIVFLASATSPFPNDSMPISHARAHCIDFWGISGGTVVHDHFRCLDPFPGLVLRDVRGRASVQKRRSVTDIGKPTFNDVDRSWRVRHPAAVFIKCSKPQSFQSKRAVEEEFGEIVRSLSWFSNSRDVGNVLASRICVRIELLAPPFQLIRGLSLSI